MDLLKKNKVLITITGILIIMNVALMATMWFGGPRPPHGAPPPPLPPEEFIARELNLSGQQRDQFRTEQEHHFAKIKDAHEEAQKLKSDGYKFITGTNPDTAQAMECYRKACALMLELDRETMHHFIRLRSYLQPEQVEKFDKVLTEMFTKMPPPRILPAHPGEGPMNR
ncbi:MAG: periplasmic heavy metal sensor [Ignavibacteria bacterium]|nr:periplasmic heavy metal sensor [Ignavibacteria bacterium]